MTPVTTKPASYSIRFCILQTVFSLLLLTNLKAQETFSIQLDIGGAAPYGSLNIEKRVFKKTNFEIKLRAGIGIAGYDVIEPPRTFIKYTPTLPFGINLLFGNSGRTNNLEIALQGTYITEMTISDAWDPQDIYNNNIKDKILSSFFVGYRFKPFKRKGLIRVGYNPILLDHKIISWGVLSLGYTVGKSKKE